jgi:thioredoxin reductase (NADPH)
MDPAYLDKISTDSKIEVIYNTNVKEIKGGEVVEKIVLDRDYQGKNELETQGVFIEIGSEPGIEIAKQVGVDVDEQGFIIVSPDQSTNIPGIYAAGDVTTGSNKMRQIITAAAEGAVAAGSVYKKIQTG